MSQLMEKQQEKRDMNMRQLEELEAQYERANQEIEEKIDQLIAKYE